MGGSSSQPQNTGYWQEPNTQESLVEEVVISPTKNKKATRNRQIRTSQSVDAPRQTLWTTEEEFALCKGWLAVSENNKDGNAKKQSGFWIEVLEYIESRSFEMARNSTSKIFNKVWGSKRHKSSGCSSFNTESGEQSINLNTIVGYTDEEYVREIRPKGRDKARKKKGSKSGFTSNINEDAFAKLMVTEMTAQEKEERLAFLDIKGREVECRERSLNNKT
ncbi:hypothetical protein Tco_1448563 [Tanacetum coccineum]